MKIKLDNNIQYFTSKVFIIILNLSWHPAAGTKCSVTRLLNMIFCTVKKFIHIN